MSKRTIVVLVVLSLLVIMTGCKKAKPVTPTLPLPVATEAVVTSTFTPVLPSATPVAKAKAEDTATPVPKKPEPSPTPTVEGPKGPVLMAPPDGLAARIIDLVWTWDPKLGPDDWFEVQIWPDLPEAEPKAYGWYQEKVLRVTAANLLPGKYRWRVVIVRGRDDKRGVELSPYSEEQTFIILRPSVRAKISVTPPIRPTNTLTNTPIPTHTRRPTYTPRPWWPPAATKTPTIVLSPTWTPVPPPTATEGPTAYPGETDTPGPTNTTAPPTETSAPPTETSVPPTDTPVPPPTHTTEPYAGPTNTTAPPATNTPAPKITNTPASGPTDYP